ncbi:MAG TPA: HisA/HisF-related TIM barrel protein [Candidatus Tectomicrobia bacterium]
MPAIDMRAGKCVRLLQGRIAQQAIYSNKPVVGKALPERCFD